MRSVKAAGRDGGDGSLLSRALGSARRAVQGRDAAIPCPPLHSAEDRRVFCSSIPTGADPLLKRQRGRYYSGGIRLRDPYRADRRFHHPGGASSGPLPLDGPRLAGWLAAHGRPQSIDELHQHRAVGYLNHRTGRTIDWLFSLDEGDCAIRMRETLVVDDTDAYIQAGIQGLGLIRVASYLAQPYLQSGALVACLEQAASDLPLSLVYPQNRYLPPAVRAFYDWSRRVLQPPHSEA